MMNNGFKVKATRENLQTLIQPGKQEVIKQINPSLEPPILDEHTVRYVSRMPEKIAQKVAKMQNARAQGPCRRKKKV